MLTILFDGDDDDDNNNNAVWFKSCKTLDRSKSGISSSNCSPRTDVQLQISGGTDVAMDRSPA
jgi:hypothetical protein